MHDHRKKVLLQSLLSVLHGTQEVHQSCHWLSKGSSFYGDHLLFERLYENIVEEVDSVAERLIGHHGSEAFDPVDHMNMKAKFVSVCSSSGSSNIDQAIFAEESVLKTLRKTYDGISRSQNMTLGLDDLIMSVSDQHERHLYLLNQRGSL